MMTQLRSRPQTLYEKTFRSNLPALQQEDLQEPAWLRSVRQTALKRFETLGFPTRRMEAWRFIDLSPILDQAFEPFSPEVQPVVTENAIESYLSDEAGKARLVFINGYFSPERSFVGNLPQGVVLTSIRKALDTHASLLQDVLERGMTEESDAFVALNTSVFQDGAFVYVPDGIILETPVQVLFLTQGDGHQPQAAYTQNLFVSGKNARLNVVSSFIGLGNVEDRYLNNAVTTLFAGEGSALEYTHIQSEGRNAHQIAASKAYLQTGSEATLSSLSFGGKLSRHHLEVRFQGEDARCFLNGLSVLNGASEVHDHTVIDHARPGCTSHQLYKGILDGNARSEFEGTIVIRKDATLSDAAQLNRNLLLSDGARVFTRPQLKIDNDDVKCSHGATVGQLEEEELFYLASRGLPADVARSVLTLGFADEIIEKVSLPSVKAQLTRMAHAQLRQSVSTQSNEVVR